MIRDFELVRARIQAAIKSTADVSAHATTILGEPWVDIHVGDQHLLQLPRDAFLEAIYFGATQELDLASEHGSVN